MVTDVVAVDGFGGPSGRAHAGGFAAFALLPTRIIDAHSTGTSHNGRFMVVDATDPPVLSPEQKLLPRPYGRSGIVGGMRVLVVEDHVKLANTIAAGLRREGMTVDLAFDGTEALGRTATTSYDVLVLDRDLPRLHGDDVCRALVAAGSVTRILMLTAATTIGDRVDGLGLGADDYLSKPFAFAELVARIQALGRRSNPPLPPTLTHGDLRVDPAQRIASRGGQRLTLSPKELAVLEVLLQARGAVVSAEDLLERVWDEMADPFTNTVKVTVSRLRAKLGDPPLIETVAQVGYRI
jgi:DNA-binding response OmpR family regulator